MFYLAWDDIGFLEFCHCAYAGVHVVLIGCVKESWNPWITHNICCSCFYNRKQRVRANPVGLGHPNENSTGSCKRPRLPPRVRKTGPRQHQILQHPPPPDPRSLCFRLRAQPDICQPGSLKPSRRLPGTRGSGNQKNHFQIRRL